MLRGHLCLMSGVLSQQEIFLLDSFADYIVSILEKLSSCYQLHFQSHFMLFERSTKHIMQNHKSDFWHSLTLKKMTMLI